MTPAKAGTDKKSPLLEDRRGTTGVTTSHLPETRSAGIGTMLTASGWLLAAGWLPRLHRAGPSTSLDKSVAGVFSLKAMIPQG